MAEQIERLFHQQSGVVWELIEAPGPARSGDVKLRDDAGHTAAFARPLQRGVTPQWC